MRPAGLLDPRNDARFDLPASTVPGRTYVVASTPRTGSTLLCRALWDTGLVGAPKEYLNPMQLRDWRVRLGSAPVAWAHRALVGPAAAVAGLVPLSDASLHRHLARVRARRTGPTGWFGLKLHHHHFRQHFLDAGRAPEDWLGPITWLRIRRGDRVAQAISWHRALSSGRWAAHQRPWRAARYDRSAIARRLVAIDAAEAAWDGWFGHLGVSPLTLTYEDVAADLDHAVRRVLGHLDAPLPAERIEPPLRRQADATSAAWAAHYLAESRNP